MTKRPESLASFKKRLVRDLEKAQQKNKEFMRKNRPFSKAK